ncbi:MAG: SRPBCC family protein [bacterium]|nr:SRPBCC family protein [bacterium]
MMSIWLLFVGIGLATIILAVAIIGRLLPAEYTFDVRRVVAATPEEVWAALNDPQRYPFSASMCKKFEPLPKKDGLTSWRENLGSSTVTYEVLESDVPQHMVLSARDSVVPMSFRAEITLQTTDGGTELRMVTRGRIDRGTWHVPMFRVIVHLGGAKAGARKYLATIGAGFEKDRT